MGTPIVSPLWSVAIDRGGTFTDVVAQSDSGRLVRRKLLSGEGQEAAAIGRLLADEGGRVRDLRIGTTVATNALLTGRGARVGLLVTEGMEDCLLIGDGRRPDLFALDICSPRPLAEVVLPLKERLLADGTARCPLDEAEVADRLGAMVDAGVEVLVVALVHSHLHPMHELRVAKLAEEFGFIGVIMSHQSSPGIGFVERCATAVGHGFIEGPLGAYRRGLYAGLSETAGIHFMKSSGGLSPAATFRGIDSVLSGPAGGAVACGQLAELLGITSAIGFDMGGTSTDVCRWAGGTPLRQNIRVAGRNLRVPTIDIATVAAGGGSLLRSVDGRAQVGPDSAGAQPGPAAYGFDGPATVTDANVVLGRLQPSSVPAVFGPSGLDRLSLGASEAALSKHGSTGVDRQAAGFLAVANARMAAATASLCLAQGQDPASHSLIAFGGAAGQHACSVAERLGIRHVVLPADGSVLSASGIAAAPSIALRSAAVLEPWDHELSTRWAPRVSALVEAARREVGDSGAVPTISWFLRYCGAGDAISARDRSDFEALHERRFGFSRPDRKVEAVKVQVRVETGRSGRSSAPEFSGQRPSLTREAAFVERRRVGYPTKSGQLVWLETPIYERQELSLGRGGAGPAMIVDSLTTVLVDPGWDFLIGGYGEIQLRRQLAPEGGLESLRRDLSAEPLPPPADAVALGLYSARFTAVATRMGDALRRVAWSINIKERLDFSCALFDRSGRLVTNAPHIPVHLGAMGATVRALHLRLGSELQEGRSWAINDPYAGGSHLPDITVITPMFFEGELVAWLANRGHHSDVGGTRPGSMPPDSRSLKEEGVLLRDLLLFENGHLREQAILTALGSSPWPCRDPSTVLGDLEAQLSANQVGLREMMSLVLEFGVGDLTRWMGLIQDNGADVVRSWISERSGEVLTASDSLDDGTAISVELRFGTDGVGQPQLVVDFSGTGPATGGNLNAPPPITRAAFLYVLRVVVGRDIPLNEGCLRPVEIRLPEGSILDPPEGSAVVGGNVETSQRVVDVLLAALGAGAASQGTMNNLSFGNEGFGYYETIPGGAGATSDAPGADGVQTHMTNTRITDVEVLETRCPVLLRRFGLRRNSGGKGDNQGGDGLIREIEFLDTLSVSMLAGRRSTVPFGMQGGEPGESGSDRWTRAGESPVELPDGSFSLTAEPGDVLTVSTPGGGGWGRPGVGPLRGP